MSELHFDSLEAMRQAVATPSFADALGDEDGFLSDVHLVPRH
ncbi:hypothetical protein [Celeribacter sp.]